MHNRPDRDRYVNIAWRNIQPSFFREFAKVNPSIFSNLGTPYDFNSIMHYNSLAFTKNGHRTIIPKESSHTDVIGQRFKLSEGDIKRINIKYKCNMNSSSHSFFAKHLKSFNKKSDFNQISKEKAVVLTNFLQNSGAPNFFSNGLPFGAPLGSPLGSTISTITNFGSSSFNSVKPTGKNFGKLISNDNFGRESESDELDELFNLKK